MLLELVAPLLHDADGGQRGGIAERAERATKHILGEVADKVDIFGSPEAGMEAIEHLAQPGGPFAAGNTPAAGLVRVEMHDAPRHVHHAGVFVHDHHAAGPEHGAGFGDGIVVHGKVDLGRAHQRAGAAAGNHGLELLAAWNAAGDFVDELLHVHAERDFVNAGLIDVAGDAKHARAAVSRCAAAGVFFTALENDGRNGAERLDVIDDGRAAVETDDGGEGRLDARVAAFAFEGLHQSGFFAALIGTRAGVHDQVEIETGAKDIFAEIVARISFVERGLDDVEHVAVFPANVNEAVVRIDRAAGDGDALDHLVRIHLHQRTVFAGARFGFVRIADDISGFRRILGDEGPFHAGGEARAAAPAEVRFLDFVDDRFRRHLLQRSFQRLIAVVLQVDIDLVRILDAEAAADDRRLRRVAGMQRAGSHRLGSRMIAGVELFDDAVKFHRRDVFVEVVVDLHRGRAGASADAFHLFQGKDAVAGGFFVADFEALLGLVQQLIAAAQHARDVGADLHVVPAHGLAAQHGIIRQRLFHLHRAQIQPLRDFRDHFIAYAAVLVLRVHHHGNERAALEGIAVLERLEAGGDLRRKLHRLFIC